MNTKKFTDHIQGTDSVAILRTTLDDLLLTPAIFSFGTSQGGKINDQQEDSQTESDLRKFVRVELDKMWAGYTRTALNPHGFISLMEGELPSNIGELGDRFAEGNTEVSQLVAKSGMIPAHYAVLAAELAHTYGFTSSDIDEERYDNDQDNRTHVIDGIKKLDGLRKAVIEDGKVRQAVKDDTAEPVHRYLGRNAVAAANADSTISSIFGDVLGVDVTLPYGVQSLFEQQMGDFFFSDLIPGLQKEKGRYMGLFLENKDLLERKGDVSSIFHKISNALEVIEETSFEVGEGNDYLPLAREKITTNNLEALGGPIDLLKFKGMGLTKETATNYQMHIGPLIEKVLSFAQEMKPHFQDGEMVNGKYDANDLLGRRAYLDAVLIPEMVEKIRAINDSADYSPDMIMHVSKIKPVRALTSRNEIARRFEVEANAVKNSNEESIKTAEEFAKRKNDLQTLGTVFHELAIEYEKDKVGQLEKDGNLEVQLNEIKENGSEIYAALRLELDDIAVGVESLSGIEISEIISCGLGEHYKTRHDDKRIIGAAEVDITTDLISNKARQTGIKSDIENQLRTFGLNEELNPALFTWYDAALGSFRYEVAKAIQVPIYDMLEEREIELTSDYFNRNKGGKGIEQICDSIAKRVAFCPIAEDGSDLINLTDVYNAFLEPKYGEMEYFTTELMTLRGILTGMPPTIPPPAPSTELAEQPPLSETLGYDDSQSGLLVVASTAGGDDTDSEFDVTSVVDTATGTAAPFGESAVEPTADTQRVDSEGLDAAETEEPVEATLDDDVEVDDGAPVENNVNEDDVWDFPAGENDDLDNDKVEVVDNPQTMDTMTLMGIYESRGGEEAKRVLSYIDDETMGVNVPSGERVPVKVSGLTVGALDGEKMDIHDLQGLVAAGFDANQKNLEAKGAELKLLHSKAQRLEGQLGQAKLALEVAEKAKETAETKYKTGIPKAGKSGFRTGLTLGAGTVAVIALLAGAGLKQCSSEDNVTIEQVMNKYNNINPHFKQALVNRYTAMVVNANKDSILNEHLGLGYVSDESKTKAARDIADLAQMLTYGIQPEFDNLKKTKNAFDEKCESDGSKDVKEYDVHVAAYAAPMEHNGPLDEESIVGIIIKQDKNGNHYITDTVMDLLDARVQSYQGLANRFAYGRGYCGGHNNGYAAGQASVSCPPWTELIPVGGPTNTYQQPERQKKKSFNRPRENRQKAPKVHKPRFRRTRIVTEEKN